MSDRELLELAAKAAGIRINHWVYDDLDYSPAVLEAGGTWHPLADDGDALRLAVKLGLTVEQWFFGQEVLVYDFKESTMYEGLGVSVHEPYGTDPLAATRRAIFRAAAEIGRNMK